jgi:hypothetical protein
MSISVAISFARLDSDIVDYLYLKSHSRVARHGRVVWPPLLAPSRRVTVSGSLPVRSHLKVAEMHRIVESGLGRLPASSPTGKSIYIQTLVRFKLHGYFQGMGSALRSVSAWERCLTGNPVRGEEGRAFKRKWEDSACPNR